MNSELVMFGMWGDNGHQVQGQLEDYPRLQPIVVGVFGDEGLSPVRESYPNVAISDVFDDFLKMPGLQFVSLCSPRRSEQADHAIAALQAGVHVYAEKPCATTEADLDRVIEAAGRSSATFHEMAGTAFAQPYWAMRQGVAKGEIGDVVQVLVQKSYPYSDWRPTSETTDGGLIAQNGIHALRFVEHVAGVRAATIEAIDTPMGESRENSDLQMASAMMGRLENGGLFSVVANYLNPTGFSSWGNEMLRIFGTKGMMESTDAGTRTRLVVGDEDRGEIDLSGDAPDWLGAVIEHAIDGVPMPIDLETELHPTRMVLRAKVDAERRRSA